MVRYRYEYIQYSFWAFGMVMHHCITIHPILLAEQQDGKRWACSEQGRTIRLTSRRLRVVQGRAGGSSPPALSRGLCVFLKRALQTQGKDAPGQSRSQAPGWGAYSYQGGVMGQQAEVANLS